MHYSRLLFFFSNLILVAAGTVSAQPVAATIDATRTGEPITRLIFGGFMEPATPAGFGTGIFSGPPAKLAESSLPEAPARVTLPPASVSVYEFKVKR